MVEEVKPLRRLHVESLLELQRQREGGGIFHGQSKLIRKERALLHFEQLFGNYK